MAPRQALMLVADEIYYNLQGKAILQGIYTTDLIIPTDPTPVRQLLLFFVIETDLSEPFTSLNVEITLPGSTPVRNAVFVPPPQFLATLQQTQPGRTRFFVRHPVLIQNPILRPGLIEAKVIHESGEIAVTGQWIELVGMPQGALSN